MTCYESNRPVTVHKAFTCKLDGKQYVWDHQMRSYCYLNEYGNPHCMTIWLLDGD